MRNHQLAFLPPFCRRAPAGAPCSLNLQDLGERKGQASSDQTAERKSFQERARRGGAWQPGGGGAGAEGLGVRRGEAGGLAGPRAGERLPSGLWVGTVGSCDGSPRSLWLQGVGWGRIPGDEVGPTGFFAARDGGGLDQGGHGGSGGTCRWQTRLEAALTLLLEDWCWGRERESRSHTDFGFEARGGG